ncbi:Nicastrin-domain-containing protein [Mortierella sp. GBAus27b]|nr:Nicastrin-domain-containing protein [Mortierella sp. GBAus27b]
MPRTSRIVNKLVIALTAFSVLAQAQGSTNTDPYDIIYTDIGSLPCVRLLHAKGIVGCQSMGASTGVLYRADTLDDIQKFVADTKSGDLKNKYTVVMPYWLLTSPNLSNLDDTDSLKAVIAVVNGTDAVYSAAGRPGTMASPDSKCPNCEFGLYANSADQYEWNPTGTGLLYQSFDFPIYALNTMDMRNTISYNAVIQAATMNRAKGYHNYPLKALQFNSFMWAAQDSGTCLRRGWCAPIGGASVWATPSVNMSSTDNKKIVVVAAAMDSRSLFHDVTMGVESSITGMVTVLSVAEALSRSSIPLDTMPKHILYTLFTAEAWGFSGSQRFVQDISTPVNCIKPPARGTGCSYPFFQDLDFKRINPANIDTILEAGPVGGIGTSTGGSSPSLYAHIDKLQPGVSATLLQQVLQMSSSANSTSPDQANQTISVQAANSDGVQRGLPPSSAMSFLQNRGDIPTVVLTDYQKQMSPMTSQDTDDTWDPVNTVNAIRQAASTISKTAWLQAQGLSDPANMTLAQQQAIASIEIDPKVVQDLLYCLTLNYSCPFVDRYLNVTASPTPPARLPHYSGTLYSQSQPFPIFAWSFLANMTSVKNLTSTTPRKTGCSSHSQTVQCSANEFCVGDQCIMSLTRYHDAYGVGIAMADDHSYYIKDASKPTWTESTWDPVGLRLFDVTSPAAQGAELATGIVLTLVSAGLVWYGRKLVKKTLKVD